MDNERPSPEQMLARVKAEGSEEPASRRRGRLRLFFGYAAGVGKTYAMLQAANALKKEGADIVVGYVEPHNRPETEALLSGLERLPPLEVPYRATTLREFNVDAALSRRPQVLLVDELAHTNAPGMRHAKRWQDIEELLAAGIDVFSTVNVQHVESLNDVISQISGVTVRETFPDAVFERADEVALIDIPPDELLARLQQGKVYIPPQAAHALQNFFRKENLVALRELALRQTADRVGEDVQMARLGKAAVLPWQTADRILVCVGPSPSSAKVVRAAKRLADKLDADWTAVHIETPSSLRWTANDRELLQEHLRLAERLGGEVVQLSGNDVVAEIVDYAQKRNVTKIVVGKTDEKKRRFIHRPSMVDRLVEDSGNIDVFVVRGIEDVASPETTRVREPWPSFPWLGLSASLILASAVATWFHALEFTEANLVMVYLLAVAFVATRYGMFASAVASVLAVLLFDMFFTQPYYNITVHDSQYLVTFSVMLGVGLLISTLSARRKYQADVARRSERRTEALYRLSKRLTATPSTAKLIDAVEATISEVFDSYAVVFTPDSSGKIRPVVGHAASFAASAPEFAAAQWVLDNNREAGLGTDTLPNLPALFMPLATPNGAVGVLAIQPGERSELSSSETRQLLRTYATQVAFAMERDKLAEQSRHAHVQVETEKLRSSLLSAVSHDLRTPLAVIAGSSSSLAESFDSLDPATRRELLQTVCDESQRLSRLVENLLQMTRISAGRLTVDKQWQPIEDVIGSALNRIERNVGERPLEVAVPGDLPLGQFDAVLIEQVLINLLDNALKYSKNDATVLVRAIEIENGLAVEVLDEGPGVQPGDEERLFELFYRGADAKPDRRGTGLGLSICKAIVQAHGGSIEIRNRPEGGTRVRFTLPSSGQPPVVALDDLEPEKV